MTSEAFKRHFEKVSADYRRRLPQKLAELDNVWTGVMTGALPPERIIDVQHELHTLAGTAETLGVPSVTSAARAAESFLDAFLSRNETLGAAVEADFRRLLEALKQAAKQ
jgi:HPt (histidine-containing phosphotransfer) domain-containing protein